MKVQLLYFSGTGNSLYACRKLESELKTLNAKVELVDIMEDKNINSSGYDAVGFLFPIHVLGIPRYLGNVIKTLNIESSTYVFAIPTFGSDYGIALSQISKILKKKGLALHASFPVQMGANNNLFIKIPGTSTILKPEEQKCVYQRADDTVIEIAAKIASRNRVPPQKLSLKDGFRGFFAYRWFLSKLKKYHRDFTTVDCSRCGRCVKICSFKNIKMTEAGPYWKKGCEGCLRCFNTCKNISHGKMDHPRMAERYVFPAYAAIDSDSGNE